MSETNASNHRYFATSGGDIGFEGIAMEKIEEQIDILIKLQKIDGEIYRLEAEKAAKPAAKQAQEQAFAQTKQNLKLKEDEYKSLQLKRKEREIDLETKEKEIKKYQTQLFQVKTNKGYASLQKEISGLKADNAVLEDDILGLMEKIDQVKIEVNAERDKLASEEQRLKNELAKIDEEIKIAGEKIAALKTEREKYCPQVEKGLLSQYERILKAKNGQALVPINGESCGGCHRVLPPQEINEARMKDKIMRCELCARLLYWPG